VGIRSIAELDIEGKRTFIRVDFNVPLQGGRITDDSRIRASLPTIRYAIERGAKVIVASHLGRPKGETKRELSLEPVGARLSELLGHDVFFTEDCIGDGARKVVMDLREGQVVLLENLRFHAGEEANDDSFARALAAHAQVYVNDAFGAAHRAHASTVGITHHVPELGIGLLMQRELAALGKLLTGAEHPFVVVVGGAKVADKIGVLENLLHRCDEVLIGGAMANTFLKARGGVVGSSKVEDDKLPLARRFYEKALGRGVAVFLPLDLVVAESATPGVKTEVVPASSVPDNLLGLDIGPQTQTLFRDRVRRAKTVLWNGPLGLFEVPPFDAGTMAFAQAVGDAKAFSVVGGGDTVAAVHQAGIADRVGHISTGGGASLEFLEGKTLPGVAALER
jgi:phosphoglycerate kinase